MAPPSSKALQDAMAALISHPVYYNHCQACLLKQRETLLLRDFLTALTRGPSSFSPPLDASSHDPPRYLTDMLTWIETSVPSVCDTMPWMFHNETLLTSELETGRDIQETQDDHAPVPVASVSLVGSLYQGLSRPLQTRMTQLLAGRHQGLELYRMMLVLVHFEHTLTHLLGASPLIATLQETRAMCHDAVTQSVTQQVDISMAQHSHSYASDLGATYTTTSQLRSLSDYVNVVLHRMPRVSIADSGVADLLTLVVNALCHLCTTSAESLEPIDAAVLMLNNIRVILQTLDTFYASLTIVSTEVTALSMLHREIAAQQESCLQVLVNLLTTRQLNTVGLSRCLVGRTSYLQRHPEEEKGRDAQAQAVPGLDPTTLTAALKACGDQLLVSPQVSMGHDNRITCADMQGQVQARVIDAVAMAHVTMATFVQEQDGYEVASILGNYTPDTLRCQLQLALRRE